MSTSFKKSSAHAHSYYLFIYYVCQIATTYLKLEGIMCQKKQHDTF